MLRRSKIFIAIAAQIAVSSVGATSGLIVQTRNALNFLDRVLLSCRMRVSTQQPIKSKATWNPIYAAPPEL